MSTVTVRIPDSLRKELDKLCRQQHRSASEVIRDSIRKYVAKEQLDALRAELRPYAEAA
jgi:predicted transcriptional regulator